MGLMEQLTQPVPGDMKDIDFVAEAEPWGKFVLEDGTIIRVRLILMGVKIDPNNAINTDGTLRYLCNFQQVCDVKPSQQALATYKR